MDFQRCFSPITKEPITQLNVDYRIDLIKAPYRPRLGEILTIRDKTGRYFRGRVIKLCESYFEAQLFESMAKNIESPLHILLLQALPEKERMEWIIQKATELGVNSIVPFSSSRSTTLQAREAKQPKSHRWPFIARKATEQSRRAFVPCIEPYTGFSHALQYARGYDLKIVLWENEREATLDNKFTQDIVPARISVLVGPEGGFTKKEIDEARQSGFIPICLGPRILRTETAAIAIIAVIQHKWGDF